MIEEPVVTIICDTCGDEEAIEPKYKYRDYSGNNGYYDCDDNSIEKTAESNGWVVDKGNHYCSVHCFEDANQ